MTVQAPVWAVLIVALVTLGLSLAGRAFVCGMQEYSLEGFVGVWWVMLTTICVLVVALVYAKGCV